MQSVWTIECAPIGSESIGNGPVYAPQQTIDNTHVQAIGFRKAVGFPGAPASAPVADTPLSLSETRTDIRHRAPLFGEHTDEVLGELGCAPPM